MKRVFKIDNLPLILIELYLVFTLFLYKFGPINWDTKNEFKFWTFIILYHLAFILGYLVISKNRMKNIDRNYNASLENLLLKYLWVFLLICSICSLIVYRNVTHTSNWIPFNFFDDFIGGIINPGQQYYYNIPDANYLPSKSITIIFACFSFIYTSMMPICVLLWKKLKLSYRIWFLCLIFFYFGTYIGVGTNKGIFNILFLLGGSFFLFYFYNNLGDSLKKYISDNKIMAIITVFLMIFSVAYFGWTMISRTGDVRNNINSNEVADRNHVEINTEQEKNNPLVEKAENTNKMDKSSNKEKNNHDNQEITNEKKSDKSSSIEVYSYNLYYRITDYITQGYYGMSLTLDKPFTSTYGIGNSDFLRSNFESLLHINLSDRTYQSKTADVWNAKTKWFSFYSYWANDVSYYGVIVIMYLLGIITAILWRDLIHNKNIVSFLILPLFIIMYFNMPGNNMVFTGMQTFCAFWELLFIYLVLKYLNIRKRKHV